MEKPTSVKLPTARGYASKDDQRTARVGLDHNSLAVLHPDLINQLGQAQLDWLVMRLQVPTDLQACYLVGPKYVTLKKWVEKHEAFRKAYDFVRLDQLNLAINLGRVGIIKSNMKLLEWLDHDSMKIQMRAVDMLNRRAIAQETAAAKKDVHVSHSFDHESLRKIVESQEVFDTGGSRPNQLGEFAGTVVRVLEANEIKSLGDGQVRRDSGRNDLIDPALQLMAMADSSLEAVPDREVSGGAEGSTAWSVVAADSPGSVDGGDQTGE